MPKGGKRPGAGRPKGTGHPIKLTLEKIALREEIRALILPEIPQMIYAQIANAKGLSYLVIRDKKTGKFIKMTEAMAAEQGDEDTERLEVWEKDPSVQAFSDLLNRLIDKPKEQEQEFKITGDAELLAKLDAGRRRAAGLE